MKKVMYLSVVIFMSQFCFSNSWASGDSFKFFGDHIEQSKENGRYTADITVGQSLEIRAKGFVYEMVKFEGVSSLKEKELLEEARKGKPFKARAGTWMFDDKKLRLLRTESDPKQYKIILKATKPGQYKVRFVGVLLGVSSCEIQVNVSRRNEK